MNTNREELLSYLSHKQRLTAGVQNAYHKLSIAENNFENLKKKFYGRYMFAFVAILMTAFLRHFLGTFLYGIWIIGLIALTYSRISKGSEAKSLVRMAQKNLEIEKSNVEYINGMNDFPSKFYSYWTIERLINLVKENRATTLQEVFNLAEHQDFQNEQLNLQQQNLAVAQSTNDKIANIDAYLNPKK